MKGYVDNRLVCIILGIILAACIINGVIGQIAYNGLFNIVDTQHEFVLEQHDQLVEWANILNRQAVVIEEQKAIIKALEQMTGLKAISVEPIPQY